MRAWGKAEGVRGRTAANVDMKSGKLKPLASSFLPTSLVIAAALLIRAISAADFTQRMALIALLGFTSLPAAICSFRCGVEEMKSWWDLASQKSRAEPFVDVEARDRRLFPVVSRN